MLLKRKVIETVETLNEEFTIDELFEHISFIENVEEGLKDIKEGRTLTESELEKEVQKWYK